MLQADKITALYCRLSQEDTSFQVLNKKSESSLKKQYNESNK